MPLWGWDSTCHLTPTCCGCVTEFGPAVGLGRCSLLTDSGKVIHWGTYSSRADHAAHHTPVSEAEHLVQFEVRHGAVLAVAHTEAGKIQGTCFRAISLMRNYIFWLLQRGSIVRCHAPLGMGFNMPPNSHPTAAAASRSSVLRWAGQL